MFGNPKQMMKQVQKMQQVMEEKQESIKLHEIEGTAGGNMVKITINGGFEIQNIDIDKTLIDVDEIDVLQDLIMAAFNDAKRKMDDYSQDQMAQVTGGMGLPGGKLPF